MSDDPTRTPLTPAGAAPSDPAADPADVDPAAELEVVDDGPISMERLSDYLDAGREPYDPEIESDPSALAQLAALAPGGLQAALETSCGQRLGGVALQEGGVLSGSSHRGAMLVLSAVATPCAAGTRPPRAWIAPRRN